jgi:hypothetical protein
MATTRTQRVDLPSTTDAELRPHEPETVAVEVTELADGTRVVLEHGSEEWLLQFSDSGSLRDREPAPPAQPPRWLGDVVAEVTGFAVR